MRLLRVEIYRSLIHSLSVGCDLRHLQVSVDSLVGLELRLGDGFVGLPQHLAPAHLILLDGEILRHLSHVASLGRILHALLILAVLVFARAIFKQVVILKPSRQPHGAIVGTEVLLLLAHQERLKHLRLPLKGLLHDVKAVSEVDDLALNQVYHLFRLVIRLELEMLQLVPLAFELLKAIGHHVLVVLEVLRLDALGYHQLLLEILSPVDVPGGGARTSQPTGSSCGAEDRDGAGLGIPPLIIGLGELAPLFRHVVAHGTSDAGGCLPRQEEVVHCFLLIP